MWTFHVARLLKYFSLLERVIDQRASESAQRETRKEITKITRRALESAAANTHNCN
jgi:hypothetical protein